MKKNRVIRVAAPIAAAALLLLGQQVWATGQNDGASAGVTKVVVGTGNAYQPYCYLDDNGKLTGYEIAVLEEVDRRLPQYSFSFDVYDFANILVSLNAGKIDIGAHEFEENANRRETYLYGTEGYNTYNSFLFVPAASPLAKLASIDNLAGTTAPIAVSQGSNYEAYVKTYNATHDASHQLPWQVYGDSVVLTEGLQSGKFSAQLLTKRDAAHFNSIHPGINLVVLGDPDKPLIVSNAFFLFKKGNAKLQTAVDGAIKAMRDDGTLERIRHEVVIAFFGVDE
jgi:L-cystine transport system substrate-binding protein